MMRRKYILVCVVLVIVLFFICIRNIPLTIINSELGNPDKIQSLYFEIDSNEKKETVSFTIDDKEEIKNICSYLEGTRLMYMGGNSGISYDEDDPVIIIHINNDHKKMMYLKSDGSFYNHSSRFQDRGNNVSRLFEYITTSGYM